MDIVKMKNYSIVFVVGRWSIGGVERVTTVLANAFVLQGWRVSIAIFSVVERSLLWGLDNSIKIIELDDNWFSHKNSKRLNSFIIDSQVDFVINQWCLPYRVTRFLKRCTKGTAAKLIAVHHNQPDCNKRISDAKNVISRFLWRIISRVNLRLVYEKSDAYVVLSPSFIDVLKNFIFLDNGRRIYSIANPITLSMVCKRAKDNVLLYVGRLEETQKRVSRIFDVWENIVEELPEWRLEIVGDGPDCRKYETRAKDLPRVVFHGYKKPAEFYAKSRILLLTSDFEGFPLVLLEAMAHGCIPVVYNSYSAAKDVVDNCGVLVSTPFDVKKYSEALLELAKNEQVIVQKSFEAKQKADDFCLEKIVQQWATLFKCYHI